MHRPFLLSLPSTFDTDLQNIRKKNRNNHFRNQLAKINILRYNKLWFTMTASLKYMSYYLSKYEMKTVHL